MSWERDEAVRQQRRTVHDAVAQIPVLDDEMPDGAFLIGWVLVAEFADPDGGRWFSSRSGTDGGESDVPAWTAKGYMAHAHDEGMFEAHPPDDSD